ncbi:MAG: hypothetical protein J4F31_02710 [Flavobacteriales bacterium]|nr:hypothetical protein [Flavobacteriales bacterium]
MDDSGREYIIDEYLTVWKDTSGIRNAQSVWLRERTGFVPLTKFNFELPLDGVYRMFLKYEPADNLEPYVTFNGTSAHMYYRNESGRIVEYTGPSTVRLQRRRSSGSHSTDVQVFQLKDLPAKAQFLLFSVTFDKTVAEHEEIGGGRYSA